MRFLLSLLVAASGWSAQIVPVGSSGPFIPSNPTFTWSAHYCQATGGSTGLSCGWDGPSTPPVGASIVCFYTTFSSFTFSALPASNSINFTDSGQLYSWATKSGTTAFTRVAYLQVPSAINNSIGATVSTVGGGIEVSCSWGSGWSALAVDTSNSGANASTSGGTVTVSLTTGTNGDAIICNEVAGNNSSGASVSAGAGFTALSQTNGWSWFLTQYQVQATAGSLSAQASYGNNGTNSGGMSCFAFKQ